MTARWALRLFSSFAAGYFLSYLLRNANAVIAPALSAELGLSAAALGLMTAAYLLAFGAFQLPLGVLLDRFGPRRVEAALLLIAAAGCAFFAWASSAWTLTVARALIGLGVSSCLMASFKAFSLHFPPAHQASLNAAVMSFGALGALTATTPLAALVPLLGWRGVFAMLSGLTLLIAWAIWRTPDPAALAPQHESWRTQWLAVGQILRHPAFWRFAPPAAASLGGFMALQGLWAMPWLTTVEGLDLAAAAELLLLSTLAMWVGFIALALGVGPLERRGWSAERLLLCGWLLALLALLAVQLDWPPAGLWWCALGLAFPLGNLAYALLGRHFPAQRAGRVATALNLAVFLGAALWQWGLGLLIDVLQAHGLDQAAALRGALACLWLAQLLGCIWFMLRRHSASNA